MAGDNLQTLTTQQVPNPTGKGGFGDHPENRNPGGWKPENTLSYLYKFFFNMDTEKYKSWLKEHPDHTVAQELAWNAVAKARSEFKYLSEVTDRTEGKAVQNVNMNVADVSAELDELESNYDKLGESAKMVMDESHNAEK